MRKIGGVFVKIIGLTGPTGAGKSELCACLARRGIPSINADKVYHQLLTPPSPCLDALKKYFGYRIIKPDGTLDRRELASIVFADGAEKEHEALNKITHGFVLARIRELITEYSSFASCPAVIADIPLLFESEFSDECDLNISVLANRQVRIDRIMKRDGLDYAAANARVAAQHADDFYTLRSDIVIYNNSDESLLEAEADKIYSLITGGKYEP